MSETFRLENLEEATVYDYRNTKVGSVKAIFVGDDTGHARFATVSTGLFGMREVLIPLGAARRIDQDDLKLPFSKQQIKHAPNVVSDGHIEPSEERELLAYYGLAS